MKLPYTEVKFYLEVKSQIGLSSKNISFDFSNLCFDIQWHLLPAQRLSV